MSLRIRIFSIIVILAALIICIGVGAGTLFMRKGIEQLEEDHLRIVADLAQTLVSSKTDFLKAAAKNIALDVDFSTEEKVDSILLKNINTDISLHGDTVQFSSITIVEKLIEDTESGNIESSIKSEKLTVAISQGEYSIPESLLAQNPDYLLGVFEGESALSSTTRVSSNSSGEEKLVFFVCVPVGSSRDGHFERILCAAFDGMYFTDLLSQFRIWNNEGDIILCDNDGCIIASNFRDLVTNRVNYIADAKRYPELKPEAAFLSLVITGKSGRNVHIFRGQSRIGYYRPIVGSVTGRSLGVTAPTVGSPYRKALNGTTVIAFICFVISCVVAFFVSRILVKPYNEAFQAKILAEQASESKSIFLANMSHEMRTPLNAVIGLSELAIGSDHIDKETVGNMEKIYNSGMTLLGIVNDLLDISKIESGKFELIPAKYDLSSLINDAATLNSIRIGSKPIQFIIKANERLPSLLLGDELRIKQMLNNLLSNAFKYTKEGHVLWSIDYEEEEGIFFLVFKITDTGIGIQEKDVEALFTEYRQFDTKANRRIEGTGLGLALVKKMSHLMGGTITVESVFGKGSTFTLRIQQTPLTHEVIGKDVAFNLTHMRHSQSKLVRNARLTRLKLPYARVLVVDDVQTNLDVARGMLKPYGMHVDCVMSGQSAIDAMKEECVQYNAIFMDHMMPLMDGIEATKKIREIGTEYARTIPIIALTANAVLGNEEMFLQNGFQAFLSKPIDIMRLDVAIRRWVRDKSLETGDLGEASWWNKAHSEEDATWEIDEIDKEKGLTQFGSEETFLSVLQSFAVNTPSLLEKMQNSSKFPMQSDAVLLHGIKGACLGICAESLGKRAEALEHAVRQEDFQYLSEHRPLFIQAVTELISQINATLNKLHIQ